MFKTVILAVVVAHHITVNQLFYFAQKLPLVGKKLPNTPYQWVALKTLLGLLVQISKWGLGVLISLAGFSLLVILPFNILGDASNNLSLFYHLFFFYIFLIGPLASNSIFSTAGIKPYTLLTIMGAHPRDYFLGTVLFRALALLIRFSLIMPILGFLFFESLGFEVIYLILYIPLLTLIYEGIFLKAFAHTNKNLYQHPLALITLLFASTALNIGLAYLNHLIPVGPILTSPLTLLVIIGLALIAVLYAYGYSHYGAIKRLLMTREQMETIQTAVKNVGFAEVNLTKEQLNIKTVSLDHLDGYDLFNTLFFMRYDRILKKPMHLRMGILGLLGLSTLAVMIINPHPELHETVLSTLPYLAPYLIFILYIISLGERFSKSLFFNCDRYMLSEPYYRIPTAILNNFTTRLKKSLSLNIFPALIIAFTFLGTGLIAGGPSGFMQTLPLSLMTLTLALFFSTHHLFLYYILQPYTVELTKKNPLFTLINTGLYILVYALMQVRTNAPIFTLVVMGITLVYTIAAIVLTYRLAPKTFRLK